MDWRCDSRSEHLLTKYEVLNSNHSPSKTKQKEPNLMYGDGENR
jgi:hypothetical protein